eukprot:229156_1
MIGSYIRFVSENIHKVLLDSVSIHDVNSRSILPRSTSPIYRMFRWSYDVHGYSTLILPLVHMKCVFCHASNICAPFALDITDVHAHFCTPCTFITSCSKQCAKDPSILYRTICACPATQSN